MQAEWAQLQQLEVKLKTLESDARIKNFIFKEADSPESIPGFPNNGEACREALAADMSRTLNLMTGIDIGVPETHVIKVSAASIDEYGTGEVVGSVQAVAEAESDLLKATMADPTIYAKIPKDCVDSLAVMDIVSLKTDAMKAISCWVNVMTDRGPRNQH